VKGAGKFQAEVTYGIVGPSHLHEYRPYLSIQMTYRDSSGAEKWTGHDRVGAFGDATAIPYAEYFNSSKTFVAEFQMAATEIVASLLKDFSR
jgi:hypothetical protein